MPAWPVQPALVWFHDLGIEDRRSYEKRIPDVLHSASNDEIAVFLRHLWATDGSVTVPQPGSSNAPKVYYATTSRELADGVMRLLVRFGIIARPTTVSEAGTDPAITSPSRTAPVCACSASAIGVHGRRGETARRSSTRSRAGP